MRAVERRSRLEEIGTPIGVLKERRRHVRSLKEIKKDLKKEEEGIDRSPMWFMEEGVFFVNSVQAKGECSLTKKSLAVHRNSSKVIDSVTLDFLLVDQDNGFGLQNLNPAQDRGLFSEGLLIDFSENSDLALKGEGFHIDLSGGHVSNWMDSSKVRKEGLRRKLQGREARKIQLMMKKGLLKASLI
ncbi:hypothetical protein Q3G72_004242 [Acer saccharum]|nr:hypothetical protein Q3G72_005855 [Acer saccharum]KAK1581245.1 hypothetical protein Q3G72_004242 [Acer saccharum]